MLRDRFISRRLLLAALLLPLLPLAFAHVARSQDDDDAAPIREILRGPAVTFDADGAPMVEVGVAEGVRDLKLTASWTGARGPETARASFEPVAGSRKLRAKLPPTVPPSTVVAYEVLAGNDSLAKKELATLPARDATRLTFCALGDSGYPARGGDAPTREQLAVAKLLASEKPQLVIHTGDIVYFSGEESGLTPLFFEPYADTLARVPFFCALGNHDVKTDDGAPALAAYPYPPNPNKNRYYSFDAANVHFVCIDSNDIQESDEPSHFRRTPQGQWLEADLAASKADWKIAYFHHPLYTAFPPRVSEQAAMRHALEKIFAEGGVDLCVCGHDHFYCRTVPVLAGKKDEQGIVHVVTGGGGGALYPAVANELTAFQAKRFHLVRFTVEGKSMKLEAIAPTKSGEPEVFDTTELVARKRS